MPRRILITQTTQLEPNPVLPPSEHTQVAVGSLVISAGDYPDGAKIMCICTAKEEGDVALQVVATIPEITLCVSSFDVIHLDKDKIHKVYLLTLAKHHISRGPLVRIALTRNPLVSEDTCPSEIAIHGLEISNARPITPLQEFTERVWADDD